MSPLFSSLLHKLCLLLLCSCARISLGDTHMSLHGRLAKTCVCMQKTWKLQQAIRIERHDGSMRETSGYFVVKQKAVPEVLLKVVEAKRLVESGKVMSIQEAVDKVGISRSSFYKYKDDIFPFHENSQGTTITLTFQMEDETGLLSDVLKIVADCGANILTIHQSIPINGVASLSLSVQVLPTTGDVSEMIEAMEAKPGVHNVKILAQE